MLYYFAPLEGVTNALYRSLHCACFPPLDQYFAPFCVPNSIGLSTKDLRALSPLESVGHRPVPQLLGNRADHILLATQQLENAGFSCVNLNLGCPSGTVFSKGRGAGALSDLDRLRRLLDECFSKTPLPISIKTRIGVEDEAEWDSLLALFCDYPLHELILHPRLRREFYRGRPHLSALSAALAKSTAPVVYSGDLVRATQIRDFTERYPQCKALMLGRGLIANPALAAELTGGAPLSSAALEDFHAQLFTRYEARLSGTMPLLHKMKELWHYMICLFPESEKHAKRLRKAQTREDYQSAVRAIFRELSLDPTRGYHPVQESQ